MKPKSASLAVGAMLALMILNPTSHSVDSPFALIGTAHAGGNGHGNGNGHDHGNGHDNGNGQGNGNGRGTASANGVGNNHGATASALGALNAAHASKQGFANASSTSRVGRVKAYAEAQTTADQTAADLADAKAALAEALGLSDVSQLSDDDVTNNLSNTTVDPTTGMTIGQLAQNVQTDQHNLASQQSIADGLLAAAANKNPVSDEARAALQGLLQGKQ